MAAPFNWGVLNNDELQSELKKRNFEGISSFLCKLSGIEFSRATLKKLIDLGVSEVDSKLLLSTLGLELVDAQLKDKLVQYKQEHTLSWLEKGLLSLEQASELVLALRNVDFQRVSTAFESTLSNSDAEEHIEPPDIDTYDNVEDMSPEKIAELEALGTTEIAEGKAAVIILGGGQGTRLGFSGPKGLYDIGLPSKASLFQLYAERIVKLQANVSSSYSGNGGVGAASPSVVIPLFIMTSPLNHAITENYFRDNNFFGLDPAHVHFFAQGTLPGLTSEGKIIMQNGFTISESPDGNGGIFNALDVSGALSMLETQYKARSVHVFSVDNVMCQVASPLFFGHALSRNSDVGNKVVWKRESSEKVGVVAKKGGKLAVVEYSELSEEMANAKGEDGKFLFGAGNICNHYFSVPFLRRVVSAYQTDCKVMPYHVAIKKIPMADPLTGDTITPNEPNGIKLEAFIFDCFSLSQQSAILEVKRAHEFGPVKNAPGTASDSPDTARRMLMDMHVSWALKAGALFEFVDGCEASNVQFEIHPLVSYDGEGLEMMKGVTYQFNPTTQLCLRS